MDKITFYDELCTVLYMIYKFLTLVYFIFFVHEKLHITKYNKYFCAVNYL